LSTIACNKRTFSSPRHLRDHSRGRDGWHKPTPPAPKSFVSGTLMSNWKMYFVENFALA
jgi:hypothetical protein